MFKQTSIILFAALCFTQAYGAKIQARLPVKISPRDLLEDAQVMLAKLGELAQGNYDAAILHLQTHQDNSLEIADVLLQVGNAQIDTEAAQLEERIVGIEQRATDANADISTCLDGRREAIDALVVDVRQHLVSCIVIRGDRIRDILNRAIVNLNTVVNRVPALERELSLCGSGEDVESEMCIAGVIGQVPEATEMIPSDIKQAVDNADDQMNDAVLALEQCSVFEITQVTVEGNEIVDELEACADQIINA